MEIERIMPPKKQKYSEIRNRKYLHKHEVDSLIKSLKGRNKFRDGLMIMMMFRHGFRSGEICELRWEQIDFTTATIFIKRLKGSKSSTHYISGDELKNLKRFSKYAGESPYVFLTDRKTPISTRTIRYIVKTAGSKAGIEFPVNAHSLRHATGYKLANDGCDLRTIQDYLGHANISNTVIYTELNPNKFRKIQW